MCTALVVISNVSIAANAAWSFNNADRAFDLRGQELEETGA
jgi:hypothetical protein